MDDTELAARLATDLDGTFEALVRAHQDRLYSVALRILRDPSDAEEVAQDAFVRAYRALGSYDADRIRELQLRGWLATIVVNLSRNRVRGRRPATVPLDRGAADSAHNAVSDTVRDHAPGPDVVTTHREERETWARLLSALPDRYRIPLVLRHVDELSYPEMAAALDRAEGTVKAQVHRGLALLRGAWLSLDPAHGGGAGDASSDGIARLTARDDAGHRDPRIDQDAEGRSPPSTTPLHQSSSSGSATSPNQAPRLEAVR